MVSVQVIDGPVLMPQLKYLGPVLLLGRKFPAGASHSLMLGLTCSPKSESDESIG